MSTPQDPKDESPAPKLPDTMEDTDKILNPPDPPPKKPWWKFW